MTENGDPTLRLVIKHITKEIHDANILSLDVSSNANPLENQFVRQVTNNHVGPSHTKVRLTVSLTVNVKLL